MQQNRLCADGAPCFQLWSVLCWDFIRLLEKKNCSISTDTQCAVLLVSVVSECFSTWCVNIKHRLISGRITRGTVCNEYLITDLCSVL